jgi:hypothetical protein
LWWTSWFGVDCGCAIVIDHFVENFWLRWCCVRDMMSWLLIWDFRLELDIPLRYFTVYSL